jgi:hypothetical protein
MKRQKILFTALVLSLTLLCVSVCAQMARPYHNGSVWMLAFIRIKPGMDAAYMNHVATEWKGIQEAAKKEGLILSYKVLVTEGHTPGDWNLILMTEVKDLATLEANEKKADALGQRLVGDDQKQMQGYRERADIREVMGNRLAREIVLEPER